MAKPRHSSVRIFRKRSEWISDGGRDMNVMAMWDSGLDKHRTCRRTVRPVGEVLEIAAERLTRIALIGSFNKKSGKSGAHASQSRSSRLSIIAVTKQAN